MAWNRWYSLKSYVRSSLWVAPILALVLQIGVERLANRLGGWMASQGWYEARTSFFWVSASEAHGLLDRIFNLSLSCLVFAFGSLLVAIQVVGGQYTPRIIAAAILRDNVIRSIVVLFSFTLLWAHRTTLQLDQGPDIPQYQFFFASLLGIGSLIAFIVLIDYCARSLRPVSIVKRVGNHGIAVIQSVYPQPAKDVPEHEIITVGKKKWRNRPRLSSSEMTDATLAVARGVAARVIHYKGRSAIIMAVNLQALVTEARRADCLIEFAPQIGDFLGTEDPLFYLYGHADAVDPERLRNLVALGPDRTMKQDPIFAFRIVVDIALKALSPAINDPSTAVLAIDQLQRMLRMVGKRSLQEHEIRDELGRARVILRTPNWEDFVHISFREIRHYGAGSMQVERRLRAMLDNLIRTLPEHRHPVLRIELELLDRVVSRAHATEDDAALARIPDSQGLGGGVSYSTEHRDPYPVAK